MSARSAPRLAGWPAAAWDALVLRELDARARVELEAAGRLRKLAHDDLVFARGDPADALMVVVEGEIVVRAVARGDRVLRDQRVAKPGEAVGEEAILLVHGTRTAEARARGPSVIAELPVPLLARALGRLEASGGAAASLVKRGMARAAARDALATSALGRALLGDGVELLLDAARHVHAARGQVLFREGDPGGEVFVVGAGLVQRRRDEPGAVRARVLGYASRGDVVDDEGGDEERADAPRAFTAFASGPVWALALPRELVRRLGRGGSAPVRRLRVVDAEGRADAPSAHGFADLYRFVVARSMLVIDQDACVRCGHCTWSCASTHEDGIARLERRGDALVVATARGSVPLLVPNSCQHCREPACMTECPTGAITRDARGDVQIRPELCTGCGACAKACPWDNIQLAPVSGAASAAPALVAVKCDLCGGRDGGPACVSACPTEAITRIDPSEVVAEVRAAVAPRVPEEDGVAPSPVSSRPLQPPRLASWPWSVGSALAAAGIVLARPSRTLSGALLGVTLLVLASAVVAKRLPAARLLAPLRRALGARAGRVGYVAHLVSGLLASGLAVAHVGVVVGVEGTALPRDVAGALTVAFASCLALGAAGAMAYATVPRRVSRLERTGALPEDLAPRLADLASRMFGALSGRSDVVKALYARTIAPYVGARFGPLALVACGRSLGDEERARLAHARSLLGDRTPARLDGLDALVEMAVSHRAARASQLLHLGVRGFLAPHVALAAVVLVLLVLHVVSVAGVALGASR